MQAFTIAAAARLSSGDRRTLQRAIQAGRLHLDAQHCLSREALIAAGYLDAQTLKETPQTPTYDPDAAYARMQALQAQGIPLAQIAAIR